MNETPVRRRAARTLLRRGRRHHRRQPPESSVVGRTSCPNLPQPVVPHPPRSGTAPTTSTWRSSWPWSPVSWSASPPRSRHGAEALGTGFVNLIKMMISPVIFCTIVLGIGSVRKAAKVGKVGGLALGYFLVMSTVALGIGLVVGNIIHPGRSRLRGRQGRRGQGRAAEAQNRRLPARHHPDDPLLAAHRGPCFDAVRRPARRVRPAGMGSPARPSCAGSGTSAAGLPGPRHDHVARPDRRVRRHRRGRRQRRLDRPRALGRSCSSSTSPACCSSWWCSGRC